MHKLTPAQQDDLQFIGENDISGSRLRQSELDDGGAELIAMGLAEARDGRIRLTLDGLDAWDELRRNQASEQKRTWQFHEPGCLWRGVKHPPERPGCACTSPCERPPR